jgi:hypothetical protein
MRSALAIRIAPGSRLLALFLGPVLLLAHLPGVLFANPITEIVLFDVRSEPPPNPPLESCEELMQHSFGTGERYVDAYFYPLAYIPPEGLGIEQLEIGFDWPAEWELIDAWGPYEGSGTFTQNAPQGYLLDWTWPDCPIIPSPHGVFRVATFLVNVTGEGYFRGHAYAGAFCYPAVQTFYSPHGLWSGGQAGLECAFCDWRCDLLFPPNDPHLEPEVLPLEVTAGETTQGEIEVTLYYWNPPYGVDYEATAGWLALEVTVLGTYEHLLTVTADAAALDPGEYSAWVRATADCAECTQVLLSVLPPGTAVEGATWGQVKALYGD